MSIVVKRVYDQPSPEDGYRVLVDRLWPRGLSHAVANLDLWLRDVAPVCARGTTTRSNDGPSFRSAMRRNSMGTEPYWI